MLLVLWVFMDQYIMSIRLNLKVVKGDILQSIIELMYVTNQGYWNIIVIHNIQILSNNISYESCIL